MKQQQRKSAKTREQILGATVQCLIDIGFVGTTFDRVAQTSGQSRGAINYHFPSRDQLIRETLLFIQQRRIEAYRLAMSADRGLSGFERSIELYWETFCDPLYVAYQELVAESRTDRTLASFLIPIHRDFEEEWDAVVLEAHPNWGNSLEIFRRTRAISTFLMDGMARERTIFGDDETWFRKIRKDLKAMLRQMLAEDQAEPKTDLKSN